MPDELPPGMSPDDPVAPDQAYTEWTEVSFAVKEGPAGEPKIMIEEDEPGLPVLRYGDAFLMLQAREGATLAEVSRLAADMRRLLKDLSYTKFTT